MWSSACGDKIIESGGNRRLVIVADKVLRGGGRWRREMKQKQSGRGERGLGMHEIGQHGESKKNKEIGTLTVHSRYYISCLQRYIKCGLIGLIVKIRDANHCEIPKHLL